MEYFGEIDSFMEIDGSRYFISKWICDDFLLYICGLVLFCYCCKIVGCGCKFGRFECVD